MDESSWGDPAAATCTWGSVVWGGTTTRETGSSVLVVYQTDDEAEVMTTDGLELFDDTGTPVELPTEFAMEHTCHSGCPSPRRLYRLDIAPATYTLVHRKRNGTNKPVHTPGAVSEDPWSTFQDDAALVSTLVVTAPTNRQR